MVNPPPPGRNGRRRGSAYIAVLGTTMLVTLLGVSGLIALRLERFTRQGNADAQRASLLAQAAVELALVETQRIDWRTRHTSQWSAPMLFGGGQIRYRFMDINNDGDLEDDPVTVLGEGRIGEGAAATLRRASVQLDRRFHRSDEAAGSVIRDGDMSSVAGWYGDAKYEHSSEGSNHFLRVKKRDDLAYGVRQNLTDRLTTMGKYDLTVSSRMKDGPDTLLVRLILTTTTGTNTVLFSGDADRDWRTVEGTMTVSWTGQLQRAELELLTQYWRQEFDVDDLVLRPRMQRPAPVVPGSWRQVVLGANE